MLESWKYLKVAFILVKVGSTTMSSAEALKAGLRGKALRITHHYRDLLWQVLLDLNCSKNIGVKYWPWHTAPADFFITTLANL